jgi:hypothetical protein
VKRDAQDRSCLLLQTIRLALIIISPSARLADGKHRVQLPPYPTTTIGSFPQTAAIRKARADRKAGRISTEAYDRLMDGFISQVVGVQEGLGIDVLVHGEPERSDMCVADSSARLQLQIDYYMPLPGTTVVLI